MHHSLEESTARARHVGTTKPPKTPMPKEHAQETESTQQEIQDDRKSLCVFFFFLLKADLPKTKKNMCELICFSCNSAERSLGFLVLVHK